jgi:hypothetical protein
MLVVQCIGIQPPTLRCLLKQAISLRIVNDAIVTRAVLETA